jgi:hypothetical protein
MNRAGPAWVLAGLLAGLAGVQDPRDEPEPDEPAHELGVYVRLKGEDALEFFPWRNESTVNQQLRRLRDAKGGQLTFAPGTYTVNRGFIVPQVPDLTISGSPGTELVFAAEPATPLTVKPALEGDTVLYIEPADGLRVGWEYQLYAPDHDLTRVLEFRVAAVEGNEVRLTKPVKFLPHYPSVPADCRVLITVNFFKVLGCPRLVIENLSMDGTGRGAVRGHTLYCGVYATGLVQHARPTISGLTVRGCTFRGLMGRGVAAYGLADVLIEDCEFHQIHAQAIEIDHYASGLVTGNLIDEAEVGVMLNDCFETVVEDNEIRDCLTAIRLLRIFPEDWINVGNIVRKNRVGPGNRRGIKLDDEVSTGLTGNHIVENHFIGQGPKSRVINPEGNTVERNTSER